LQRQATNDLALLVAPRANFGTQASARLFPRKIKLHRGSRAH
jgi:hypothetical protein